jgi:hypothetical protein
MRAFAALFIRVRRPRDGAAALAALCLAALPACERAPSPPAPPPPVATSQPSASQLANVKDFVQSAAPAPAALPPGHPPLDANATVMPPGATTGPAVAPLGPPVALQYDPPPRWQKQPVGPGTLNRVDQYRLPAAAGSQDGELAILTGIGGGLEANVQRWRGQFTTAAGQPVPDDAFHRETFDVNGLKVTFVDVTGRYAGAAMGMGSAAESTPEDYRMLAAIVETSGAPWFLKAIGPAPTMAASRDEFMAFLKTVRPQ